MHIFGGAMDELLTPADIERLAGEAGLTLKEVCARAGIAQSTFSRWRAGKTAPSIDVYQRLLAALRREIAEKAA
jgi:transcriptional regulator with XRE-family HTH domain